MGRRRAHATILLLAVAVCVLFGSYGCSTDRPDSDFFAPGDVGALVVDARLIVGQPLPAILLSRASGPGEAFDFFRDSEGGASIHVQMRGAGAPVEYHEVGPGTYAPLVVDTVKAEATYDLLVTTMRGETVTATTTTPAAFRVDSWVLLDDEARTVRGTLRTFAELGDGVYTAPENQVAYTDGLLEARVASPVRVGYQVGVFSLDEGSDFVIDPAFFEEDDFASLDREASSPALEAPDGRLRLPWFVIFFEGRHLTRVYSVDEAWFDLIRTLPENTPAIGGVLGDAFARPVFNIDGGIGLFGSAAVDSIGFYVNPRP